MNWPYISKDTGDLDQQTLRMVYNMTRLHAVEVKMLWLMGDNGKTNDNMIMYILSPYPAHRSALTPDPGALADLFKIQ